MNPCILCDIASGKIPTAKLYETDDVFVFLDNNPLSIGHTLVIPKSHESDTFTISEKLFGSVMIEAKRTAHILEKALHLDGMNVLINNRPDGGQELLHLHVHVIPRYKGVPMHFGERMQYKEGEQKEVAEKIRAAMNS